MKVRLCECLRDDVKLEDRDFVWPGGVLFRLLAGDFAEVGSGTLYL